MATKFVKAKELFDNKDNAVVIQPLTMEGVEQFSLWDNTTKKFLREGQKVEIDGKEYTIDKYIKLTDEQKKRYGRNLKINRKVLIGDEEVLYPMPITVDEQLRNTMETVEKMGKNPLEFSYIVSRITGKLPLDTKYEVTVNKEVSKSASRKNDIALDDDEELSIDDEEPLSERETDVVEAIKRKIGDYATKDVSSLVTLLQKNVKGLSDERAKTIVTNYLR